MPVYASAQGDTLATHVFASRLEMLLHEQSFMRRLAAYKGDTKGSGSTTLKTGQLDDDDIAETVAEGSAISGDTALTDSSYTITPGRQAIKRILSEWLASIDSTGLMREEALAMYNFSAVMRRFDQLFGAQMASLTGTVGSTGVAADLDVFLTGTQTLRTRNVRGKLACVMHPHQFNNLQSDARAESNTPWQIDDQISEMVRNSSGDNYVGRLQRVDLWESTLVPDANGGADHGGGIIQIPADSDLVDGKYIGDAAIAYAEGSPSEVVLSGNRIMAPGGTVYTNFDFDIDKSDLQMVTNYFVGVAVADAAKGIKFITDHI